MNPEENPEIKYQIEDDPIETESRGESREYFQTRQALANTDTEYASLDFQSKIIALETSLQKQQRQLQAIQNNLKTLENNPEVFLKRKVKKPVGLLSTYLWTSTTLTVDGLATITETLTGGIVGLFSWTFQHLTLFLMHRSFKRKGADKIGKMNWSTGKEYLKQLLPFVPLLTIHFFSLRRSHNKEAEEDSYQIKKLRSSFLLELNQASKKHASLKDQQAELIYLLEDMESTAPIP